MLLEKSTTKVKKFVWLSLEICYSCSCVIFYYFSSLIIYNCVDTFLYKKQSGSYECGYYIMKWMTILVHFHITTSWETIIISLNRILCNFFFLYKNWNYNLFTKIQESYTNFRETHKIFKNNKCKIYNRNVQ